MLSQNLVATYAFVGIAVGGYSVLKGVAESWPPLQIKEVFTAVVHGIIAGVVWPVTICGTIASRRLGS